ncbi:MAG: Asp/Glu/hydantoin racemase [Pseudooceanicola sp.]|jgi:Asp/Glu/hydantoin racemase|nr:Asp/Glu/hydantoin racemase [Pseudooceanicola sp.]
MSARGPILVINPNSTASVTQAIADAVSPFATPTGPAFETVGIAKGPATIASMADAAQAALNVAEVVQARPDASAYVIACFSDPGLELCRSLVPQPVLGIQEAGILAAMGRADLFGIIALGAASVARHRLRIRQMGVEARLVAELPLNNASAHDVGTNDDVFQQTLARGAELKAAGAGAIVLGCAGFSPRRAALQDWLGIAVVDPVQAGAAMALAAVMG